MQENVDRSRSVDRYHSDQRLNFRRLPQANGRQESVTVIQVPPKQYRTGRSLVANRDMNRDRTSRWRSPSLNTRLLQNFYGFVTNIFERGNGVKKRQLAEQLLWTAARKNETEIFVDIMKKLMENGYDINAPNEWGWNLVDEAVMLGHAEIAADLFKNGGKETEWLCESKQRRQEVLRKALRRLEAIQVPSRIREHSADTRQLVADVAVGPTMAVLQKMMQNVERTRPPRNYLDRVIVEPCGDCSVAVSYEPRSIPPGIISRFKVEWSRDKSFKGIVDYQIFSNLMNPERLIISELDCGIEYHIRLSVANLSGFGIPLNATPSSVVITSWRDVDGQRTRLDTTTVHNLEKILQNIRTITKYMLNDPERRHTRTPEKRQHLHRAVQRRASLKDSIRDLIRPHIRPANAEDEGGMFLSCMVIADDSILLTNEYTLPSVVVHSPFIGSISSKDYLWFQKLTTCWDAVAEIKELLHSSKDSSSDLRYRIVRAVSNLQNLLTMPNLGIAYYRPLRDKQFTSCILLLIQKVNKSDVGKLSGFQWKSLKEADIMAIGHSHPIMSAISTASTAEIYSWYHDMHKALPPGLHMAYAELSLNLDSIAVVTAKQWPNILPSAKIRSNAYISSDEWYFITRKVTGAPKRVRYLESLLQDSWQALKSSLSLRSVEELFLFPEVIELGPETSILVVYGEKRGLSSHQSLDEELRKNCSLVPVQIFEAGFHFRYRTLAWSTYAQSSVILEGLVVHLQQLLRQELETNEEEETGALLHKVQLLQERLESIWGETRWMPSLIRTMTRDRSPAGRISLFSPLQPQKPPRKKNQRPNDNNQPVIYNDDKSVSIIIGTANFRDLESQNELLHELVKKNVKSTEVDLEDLTTAADSLVQVLYSQSAARTSPHILPARLLSQYSLGSTILRRDVIHRKLKNFPGSNYSTLTGYTIIRHAQPSFLMFTR
ncbi:ankyrin repeat and fibronectin type-III domain-containing protein 1-like isoform X2 [Paramacrobiotus metropolitanus]|uniref:ankyrin repeat and fibronectin type-III domain-containing protein 1-like isoform X2 n=1 Tax=Paramacrobiotus metropolitanus TaxID=2943436 RepID=UPI0024456EED|nr:ankyrin repeat and fibronectin type-III domain-containing protein 1-like isoform X2 [Paramacrobiotus metropolitanus]